MRNTSSLRSISPKKGLDMDHCEERYLKSLIHFYISYILVQASFQIVRSWPNDQPLLVKVVGRNVLFKQNVLSFSHVTKHCLSNIRNLIVKQIPLSHVTKHYSLATSQAFEICFSKKCFTV